MKTKTKVILTLGLLSLLALGGLTQSKYVRHAVIDMDITNEADVAMRNGVNPDNKNTSSGWIAYPVEKTGYYAIQLKGGDGGTNNAGIGGKGGVVEEVYYLEKGQVVYYSLGGRGGFYSDGSSNQTSGGSEYNTGGTGGSAVGLGDQSSRQGGGGGGASIVRLNTVSGTDIMIAGGGGGGAGGGKSGGGVSAAQTARPGGIGGVGIGSDNTGVAVEVLGSNGLGDRNSSSKDGQNGTLIPVAYHGGGAGGGGKTSGIGGARGNYNGSYGSGSGGSSWLVGTLNGKNALRLTDYWKDIIGRPVGFELTSGQGGSQQQGGQIRIAFLWSDTTADHKGIGNIYK